MSTFLKGYHIHHNNITGKKYRHRIKKEISPGAKRICNGFLTSFGITLVFSAKFCSIFCWLIQPICGFLNKLTSRFTRVNGKLIFRGKNFILGHGDKIFASVKNGIYQSKTFVEIC